LKHILVRNLLPAKPTSFGDTTYLVGHTFIQGQP